MFLPHFFFFFFFKSRGRKNNICGYHDHVPENIVDTLIIIIITNTSVSKLYFFFFFIDGQVLNLYINNADHQQYYARIMDFQNNNVSILTYISPISTPSLSSYYPISFSSLPLFCLSLCFPIFSHLSFFLLHTSPPLPPFPFPPRFCPPSSLLSIYRSGILMMNLL